jgi:hypothetical protein
MMEQEIDNLLIIWCGYCIFEKGTVFEVVCCKLFQLLSSYWWLLAELINAGFIDSKYTYKKKQLVTTSYFHVHVQKWYTLPLLESACKFKTLVFHHPYISLI